MDKRGGGVILIDPMDAVVAGDNHKDYNVIPDYSKMFMFAELIVRRKERTIIQNTGKEIIAKNVFTNTTIGLMGFESSNENNINASTSWSTNIPTDQIQYEGFGITKIDVKMNSSYIPEVNIEFVDIKGLTFFNLGDKSPYSVLFDFPPPIFELTLKGFYGKALTYELHLVRTNTKFDSNNGNFIINVDFIARTFAPLADVPFKFIETFALLESNTENKGNNENNEENKPNPDTGTVDENSTNTDIGIAPKNTFELIKKTNTLYSTITKLVDASEESKNIADATTKINSNNRFLDTLFNYYNYLNQFKEKRAVYIINNDNGIDDIGGTYRKLKTNNPKQEYEGLLSQKKGEYGNKEISDRLCLSVEIFEVPEKDEEGNVISVIDYRTQNKDKITRAIGELTTAKDNIKKLFNELGSLQEPAFNSVTISDDDIYYDNKILVIAYIDITELYNEIKQDNYDLQKILMEQNVIRNSKFNQAIAKEFGEWKPTLYNVMELICNDVDGFFNKLRDTSIAALNHHDLPQNRNLIVQNTDKFKDKISAFPLYINDQVVNDTKTRTREIPIDISEKTQLNGSGAFPEIDLIDSFINVFILNEKLKLPADLRTQEDGNNTRLWIPFSPLDAAIGNGGIYSEFEIQSPYALIEKQYPNDTGGVVNKIIKKSIERFYILSQITYRQNFYDEVDNFDYELIKGSDIRKLTSGGEAVNIANSLINTNVIDNLISLSITYKDDIDRFFTDLETKYGIDINNVNKNFLPYGNLFENEINDETNTFITESNNNIINIYNDPIVNNDSYVGIRILNNIDVTRLSEYGTSSRNDILSEFAKNSFEGNFKSIDGFKNFFGGSADSFTLTTENVLYIKDNNGTSENFGSYYLEGPYSIIPTSEKSAGLIKNWGASIKSLLEEIHIDSDGNEILFLDYINEIMEELDTTTPEYMALVFWIVSTFGQTISPYRSKPYYGIYGETSEGIPLSTKVPRWYMVPAIIEARYFFTAYMGGLVLYNEDGDLKNEIDKFYEIFHYKNTPTIVGVRLPNSNNAYKNWIKNSLYLDSTCIVNLSLRDSDSFKQEFYKFLKDESIIVINNFKILLEKITESGDFSLNNIEEQLSINVYKKRIFEPLYRKKYILNYNQITFNPNLLDVDFVVGGMASSSSFEFKSDLISNKSINDLINDENYSEKTKLYFREFFGKLYDFLDKRKNEVQNIETEIRTSVDDNSVKNQLYYSFKNINDKWLYDLKTNITGFPTNRANESLIKRFAFVDRANNPIGDKVIINLEPLLNVSNDYDVSVFSVISRLLSINNFEFFPLQNLMSFKDDEWKKSFEISTTVNNANAAPYFVCMYIGGRSSYLTSTNSYFESDGILDIVGETSEIPDFYTSIVDENLKEVSNNDFPFSETRAFKVRYAEQNQSLFTNIELDSKEYPETNESLQILGQIAQDGSKQSPVPKAQNLFNLYETRSYSSRIEMLGNMMIQPTQYFQLENVPMFGGAYLILEVNHMIQNNFMKTSFNGVRILKFPNPLITPDKYLTVLGIPEDDYIISNFIGEDITTGISRLKNSELYEESEISDFVTASTPKEDNISITWDTKENNSKYSLDKRIKKLHPLTRDKAFKMINDLSDNYGINVIIPRDGHFRSFEEQTILYEQGRGNDIGNKIVTEVQAGKSYHNYGLAFDVVEIRNGKTIYTGDTKWDIIAEVGKKYFPDLTGTTGRNIVGWGGDFGGKFIDKPHFQDHYGLTTSELLQRIVDGRSIGPYPVITNTERRKSDEKRTD